MARKPRQSRQQQMQIQEQRRQVPRVGRRQMRQFIANQIGSTPYSSQTTAALYLYETTGILKPQQQEERQPLFGRANPVQQPIMLEAQQQLPPQQQLGARQQLQQQQQMVDPAQQIEHLIQQIINHFRIQDENIVQQLIQILRLVVHSQNMSVPALRLFQTNVRQFVHQLNQQQAQILPRLSFDQYIDILNDIFNRNNV